MLQNSAQSIFLLFFYLKNKRLARAKNDVVFIFFKIARTSAPILRTDAKSYRPYFIYKRLYVVV